MRSNATQGVGGSASPAPKRRDFFGVVGKIFNQRLVPFLIPDLERDQTFGVYVTVARARAYTGPAAQTVRQWYATVTEYFTLVEAEMKKWLGNGDQLARQRLLQLLAVEEPREVRLGYVKKGSDGSAIGDSDLRDALFKWLSENLELLATCTVEPDTLSLAPGFALDRVSDVMVGIGKAHVIEFTKIIAQTYGFDSACMRDVDVENVWNSTTLQFERQTHRLPVDDAGKVILLVPSDLVRSAPPLNVRQFFADYPEDKPNGRVTKSAVLSVAKLNPGRLTSFATARLKDPDKYKARKNLRPEPETRKNRKKGR